MKTAAIAAACVLRFVGYWLAECGHRIDAWAGIEAVKAGGTD